MFEVYVSVCCNYCKGGEGITEKTLLKLIIPLVVAAVAGPIKAPYCIRYGFSSHNLQSHSDIHWKYSNLSTHFPRYELQLLLHIMDLNA